MPRQTRSSQSARCAALVLGLAWGCYTRGAPPLNEETVSGRLAWTDVTLAPLQYRRPISEPYVGPYFVLVSESGHFCAVTGVTYTRVRDHERWACDWRPPRPS